MLDLRLGATDVSPNKCSTQMIGMLVYVPSHACMHCCVDPLQAKQFATHLSAYYAYSLLVRGIACLVVHR